MKNFLIVEKGNQQDTEKIRQWATDCQTACRPCIIVFQSGDLAEIACDNWTSATTGSMPADKRRELEKPLSQLLNEFPDCACGFMASEGRDSSSENLTHLWFTFTNVRIDQAELLAERAYEALTASLQEKS